MEVKRLSRWSGKVKHASVARRNKLQMSAVAQRLPGEMVCYELPSLVWGPFTNPKNKKM